MGEEWRAIKGYEGIYEVSSDGRVRSVDRVIFQGDKPRNIKGITMTGWNNGNGYLVVTLMKKGKRKNHYVHRLVAEHFIKNPNNLPEVNHIDYNKSNNTLSNLEWVTSRENKLHSKVHMSVPHKCKTNTGHSYITKRKNSNKYRITVDKKEYTVDSLEEAILIRNKLVENRGRKYE